MHPPLAPGLLMEMVTSTTTRDEDLASIDQEWVDGVDAVADLS